MSIHIVIKIQNKMIIAGATFNWSSSKTELIMMTVRKVKETKAYVKKNI